jgi:hypothetical protein
MQKSNYSNRKEHFFIKFFVLKLNLSITLSKNIV